MRAGAALENAMPEIKIMTEVAGRVCALPLSVGSLLSDGDDKQSHVTRGEAIEMAQRAEAIVYTISTNVSGTKGAGDKVLERIADATGGRAFFPFQIRDVSNDFAEIADELRSQYAVSYKPADFKTDGHYRTIEIVANDRKNFRVRARRGYYAPAQ